MPIYEYVCGYCPQSEPIEMRRKVGDLPPKCAVCAQPMERIVSVPARPQFKGTGFYETDYKKVGK